MEDVVCIWKHGLESLDLFHKHSNSFDKNVKFKEEFDENDKLPFLDILLIKWFPFTVVNIQKAYTQW